MNKLLFLIFILLSACSGEDFVDINPAIVDGNEVNVINDDFVSKVEASDISNLFFSDLLNNSENKKLDTRSIDNTAINKTNTIKTIKAIETLFYEENNIPAMYIINYNGGGFVIVSATKNYYPILAYSDNSTISTENIQNMNDGLTLWAEEAKLAIKESKALSEEISSKIRNLWTAYETKNEDALSKSTYSFTNEQYMRFYQRMSELYTLCPGYSFGPLSSAQNFLPQTEYNNLINTAKNYGSPPECTIVGYKYNPTVVVGPLIGTEWHQNQSFNDLCPNQYPAGCVAIAMSQIMKFHKVPKTYNWDNMPNTFGTSETQKLIYDVGRAAKMDYGTDGSSSNIDDAKNAFSSMGYNVSKKNHNYQEVKNELLIQKRPVYMRGERRTFLGIVSWKGHAWVCEGAKSNDGTVKYFAEYQLSNSYSSVGGPSWQSPATASGYSSLYFYLNWGWGQNEGNGWFGFNDVNSQLGSYEYDRQNLYVYPR